MPCERTARIELGGVVIAESDRALRVLETSHPPTLYLPLDDVAAGVLAPAAGSSFCEFKGRATYFDVAAGGRVAERAAWTFPEPDPSTPLAGHVSSTRAGWTPAGWARSASAPRPAISTAAGSPPTWRARSRARQARAGGERR